MLSSSQQLVHVSIIIASYNKEKYIEETLRSVSKQTYTGFEAIVVDDCSTDTTVEKVKKVQQSDNRIKLIVGAKNHGANYCRNIGIKEAKGKYVLFLDADDLLTPDCLEKRITFSERNPNANLMVFTMGLFLNTIGDDKRLWVPRSKDPLGDFLKHDLPWSILQPFWKKEFLVYLNGFDESFKRMQDVELHTRALLDPKLKYELIVSVPDCYYRVCEERKNISPIHYLERRTQATLNYCNKFSVLVNAAQRKKLQGTIYQTLLQVLLSFQSRKISVAEFHILEKELLSSSLIVESGSAKRFFLKLYKHYNLLPARVPGVNYILKKALLA